MAMLQGYELEPSNLGGWSLDKHHILNLRSGMSLQGQNAPVLCVFIYLDGALVAALDPISK